MTQIFLDFKGKVVLVTGSTRGIGKAIAEIFGAHDATVIVNSRHSSEVAEACKELENKGYDVYGAAADVGNEEEAAAMMKKIDGKFHRLDVIVNNAALREAGRLESFDKAPWERVFQTNLLGTFNVSKAAAEIMKRNGGAIINLTSSSAFFGRGMMTRGDYSAPAGIHYIASKGAIFSLTRAFAWELAEFGIRVNAVMPSLIRHEADSEKEKTEEERIERWLSSATPFRRFGSPEEVARVCLFLASDLASYVTGEVIALGGQVKPGIEL